MDISTGNFDFERNETAVCVCEYVYVCAYVHTHMYMCKMTPLKPGITNILDDTLLFMEKMISLINSHYTYPSIAEGLKDIGNTFPLGWVDLPAAPLIVV